MQSIALCSNYGLHTKQPYQLYFFNINLLMMLMMLSAMLYTYTIC